MQNPGTVTIEYQSESDGWVVYSEGGARLPFPWKSMSIPGRHVTLPPSPAWAGFCQQHGAPWAVSRAQEIIQRVAERLAQEYPHGGEWRVSDDGVAAWLDVYPNPSKSTRVIDRVLSLFDLFK